MKLVFPSAGYENSYRAYIQELGDEARYPFPLDFDAADFTKLLRKLENLKNGIGLPEGSVPSTTFWLVEGSELIGVSNLRHNLNHRIRHVGGHVGLGVRPSYRGKQIGNLLLRLTIEKAVERGIRQIHIHCYKHNEASARMIIDNNGHLESEIEDNGEVVQRYVVSAP